VLLKNLIKIGTKLKILLLKTVRNLKLKGKNKLLFLRNKISQKLRIFKMIMIINHKYQKNNYQKSWRIILTKSFKLATQDVKFSDFIFYYLLFIMANLNKEYDNLHHMYIPIVICSDIESKDL